MSKRKASEFFTNPESGPGPASLTTMLAGEERRVEAISRRLLPVPDPEQSDSEDRHGDDEPLVVQFLRNGDVVEEHTAEDGHDAVRIIIVMMARLDVLQVHDAIRISRV